MKKLSRSELYKKVWTTPMVRLAPEFSISDVALAKTCKKYNIPRPPRGYWARIANGYKDKKTALPKGENLTIEFDIESNKRNREFIQLQKEKEKKELEAVQPAIEMAQDLTHPLADRFRARIGNIKPDSNGLLKMRRSGLPDVEIAEDAIDRVARFLSLIAYALTEQKVTLSKSSDSGQLIFKRDGFGISIKISQALVREEREPTLEEKRKPSWEWDLSVYRPTQKLTLVLQSEEYISGRKKWTETNANNIVNLVAKIAARIDELLRGLEEARITAIEREKRREVQKVINEKNRRIQDRLDHIAKIQSGRIRELVRASMLWKEHTAVTEFVKECESRWGSSPTAEQEAWISWGGCNKFCVS
jgi:low affinity Fe/Cu permease